MNSKLTELCVVLHKDLSKVASRDQLHHDVNLLRRLIDSVQLGNAKMLHTKHRVQLASQLRECLVLALLLDDFDGTWQLCMVLNCSLHFAEHTAAKKTRESVAFQDILDPVYFVNLVILFLKVLY